LPALYRKYGQQLRVKVIEVSGNEAHASWMAECRTLYGVPDDETNLPILFLGDDYLVGTGIQSGLAGLIEQYVAQGGTDYPDVPAPDEASVSTATFSFFFSPTCPHCRDVEENVLPQIEAKYGDRVQMESLNVSDEANLRALIALGQLAGLPEGSRGAVPVVFIGDEWTTYALLLGGAQIQAGLDPALEWFLDIGGVGQASWWSALFVSESTPTAAPAETATTPLTPQPDTPTPSQPDTPTPSQPDTPTPSLSGSEIHLAYFTEAGCSDCDRVANLLNAVQNRYPNLVIHEFNILDKDDASINVCLSRTLDVPADQRHDAPAVFVGEHYLVDDAIRLDPLIELVAQYAETGAPPAWADCTGEEDIPPPPPWWVVIGTGLIDGVNPCAFATIIFFVSYLTLIERRGRDIVLVGVAFTVGVFLSYLGFGFGLRQVLTGIIELLGQVLKIVLYGLIAALCVVLAILSFGDYRKARRGRVRDMALRLPDRLRRRINATIRRGVGSSEKGGSASSLLRLIAISFATAVVVSFIELTCTGQFYVPIILGLSQPEYRWRAVLSLIVYCLAFVVPLIVVFIAVYTGTSSRQLGAFLQRHTATVKLLTACVFVVLAASLVYMAWDLLAV
jgi:cytochrome c biogenesis protein CcdA/thiol-disulfide isomerase/thioredoxin